LDGNNEKCTEASPGAGRWYIGLYGYKAFSGVILKASYEGGDNDEIEDGQTISDLSGSETAMLVFYIDVPENATNLEVEISGGSGDVDLYTRLDAEPTTGEYDCRAAADGNRENCTKASPEAGRWYIGLYGYKEFSGVSLTASYEGGDTDPDSDSDSDEDEIENGETISDLSGSQADMLVFYIDVPESATDLDVEISGGSGDVDLYTRFDAEPTTGQYDCSAATNGNRENCTEASPKAGRWYIGLYGYTAFSDVSLTASYEAGGTDLTLYTDPVPEGQCVTATNGTHISQGRAYPCGMYNWMACAVGSGDDLGRASSWFPKITSVQETATDYWERVTSCP
jgi:hypothetical protein